MVESHETKDVQLSVWSDVLTMSQMLTRQLDRQLNSATGLSGTDYAVLHKLSSRHASAESNAGVRMTDLADSMMWSKSRLSHQVSRMEARNLVRRETCQQDGRGLSVVMTEAGVDAYERAQPVMADCVEQHLIAQLTDEQLVVLREATATLIAHLSPMDDRRSGTP